MGNPTKYPVWEVPTPQQAVEMGENSWIKFMNDREVRIANAQHDPLTYGYEPPIWRVMDALLDFNFYSSDSELWTQKNQYNKAMRDHLGFDHRVEGLFVLGGNRGAKTQYVCKRSQLVMCSEHSNLDVWMFHMTGRMSIDNHQSRMWEHLPPALRKQVSQEIHYVTWKKKTGFGDNSYVLPNGSTCTFKAYTQNQDDAIQGPAAKLIVASELIPAPWVADLMYRVASTDGNLIIEFTPKNGYSPTVQIAYDGAKVVKESIGYLLPIDGGEPDIPRALGLTDDEYAAYEHARKNKDTGFYGVPARPEQCDNWLKGLPSQPEVPANRKFQKVPRVLKCQDPQFAIVHIHTSDNPFGNPPRVVQQALAQKDESTLKERFYGWATKQFSARLAAYDEDIHVVPDEDIPTEGIRVRIIDPASDRKFFMSWFLVTADAIYQYREWPGNYEIPNHGVPGPWAVPGVVRETVDGAKRGLDGRQGTGQRSLGWGLHDYKREIARLEKWPCYNPTATKNEIESWTPYLPGAKPDAAENAEFVQYCFVDARAASAPRVQNDVPTTLLTDLNYKLNLNCRKAPADHIDDGVNKLNDLMSYDYDDEMSFFNKPQFYLAESCVNTRFSFQVWTGFDGNKGASKDPIDNARYMVLCGLSPGSQSSYEIEGGGHW